jgi:hypothetical protein
LVVIHAANVTEVRGCLTDGRSAARGKRQDVWTKLRRRQPPDEPRTLTPRVGLQR